MNIKYFLARASLAVAVVALPMVAHAQFGGLAALKGGNKAGSADVGAEVDKFMNSASDANILTGKSLAQMLEAISATEQSTALAAAAKDAAEITNPKEKNAKMGAANADLAAAVQKAMADKDNQARVAALDGEKKKKLAKSFFNYALGVLRTKDVIPQGQNVVKSVAANPMEIGKVAPVKDVLPQLEKIASNSTTLMKTVPDFFKQTGISVDIPKASNAKAEDTL